MMSIGPFGDTEYTPAMSSIAQSLGSAYGSVQLTMTSYLVGSAAGRLLYGPISDRYGRRRAMLAGTLVLVVGTLACLLSFAMWPLVAARLVQGVGACAGGVIADVIVRDAFAANLRQRVYAKLNAAFAMAPAIGPVFGIYITKYLGWHGNFALLLVLSLWLLWLVWRHLPETIPKRDPQALQPPHFWRNYRDALATEGFVVYVALGGFAVGVVYAALTGAPRVVEMLSGGSDTAILVVAAVILVCFVAGAGLCALLSGRLHHFQIIGSGIGLLLVASLALLWVSWGAQPSLAVFLAPVSFCFVAVGFLAPAATARAMAPFKENTGTASSLLGSLQMAIAALGTLAMSLLPNKTVTDVPIVFVGLSSAAAFTYVGFLMRRRIKRAV